MAREYKINASDYLQELSHSNYEIVKGEPDIRGWTVKDSQGNTIGEVEELLFDPQARKVRYLILDLEGNVWDLEPRDVVVPVGLAELHAIDDDVILPNITAAQLQTLPVYDRDAFNPEVEDRINRVFSGAALPGAAGAGALANAADQAETDYTQAHFSSDHLYRNRRAQTVIGLFPEAGQARQAMDELLGNGFSRDNVEMATRDAADPAHGYAPDRFNQFFDSLFLTPAEATRYRERAQSSQAVIAVHTYSPEEAWRAAAILDHYSTVDLNADDEAYTASTASVAGTTDTVATPPIPIIEEKVEIGKQAVETGGARLRSRIVERPVEENLRLRQERVRIERVPVNRPATEADLASFQEGSIELTEYAEVPVVSKEARVVEEVNIGKEVEEHDETIRETERRTDVQVDEFRKDDYRRDPDAKA
jgi:stress response protein YsnF